MSFLIKYPSAAISIGAEKKFHVINDSCIMRSFMAVLAVLKANSQVLILVLRIRIRVLIEPLQTSYHHVPAGLLVATAESTDLAHVCSVLVLAHLTLLGRWHVPVPVVGSEEDGTGDEADNQSTGEPRPRIAEHARTHLGLELFDLLLQLFTTLDHFLLLFFVVSDRVTNFTFFTAVRPSPPPVS